METLAQALLRSGQEVPERIAATLLYNHRPEESLSYKRLVQNAVRYAQAMEAAGIPPGEVVVLILPHGADLLSAFFGAVLHGAVPSILPFLTEKLSPERYRQSLAALFEITQPAGVVTYPEFGEEVRLAGGEEQGRALILSGDILSGVGEREDWETTLPTLPGLRRSADDLVLLQHSSGTTGLQKGVALSHRAVFNQIENYAQALHLSQQDVVVSWLPLYHDMGLIAGFLLPFLTRIHLVLLSPFDWVRAPARLLQAVSRFDGTLTWLPNFAFNFCAQKIRERDLEQVDLSSWRAVINCSEPMHWKSHEWFQERFQPYGLQPGALSTCYAMAENVFAVTQGGIDTPVRVDLVDAAVLLERQVAKATQDGEAGARLLSAGRPVGETQVRILDPQGHKLPSRCIGEIALKSNCMLTGYYRRPDLTEKAFLDGWYLTGDLGYLAEGELFITGRKKDLIIVGGKNIYPQDLERLAGETPGIHPGRVVAFGVFNEKTGTEDVVLIAESDLQPGPERLLIADKIRQRVTRGSDVTLRYVEIVGRNWLLKTSSGKVARAANREKYLLEKSQAGFSDFAK